MKQNLALSNSKQVCPSEGNQKHVCPSEGTHTGWTSVELH